MNALSGPICAVLAIAGFGAVQSLQTATGAGQDVAGKTWQGVPLSVRPIIRDGQVRSVVFMEYGVTLAGHATHDPATIEALAQDAFQTAVRTAASDKGVAAFDEPAFQTAFRDALATRGATVHILDVTVTFVDERAETLLRQPKPAP